MIEWTGVLAVLGQPSTGGLTLAVPERLLSRPLPLPLFDPAGHPVGAITHLSIHADQLRAEGAVRNGLLTPGRPMPVTIGVHTGDHGADYGTPTPVLYAHTWRLESAQLLTGLNDTPPWPQALIRMKEDTP
jgi:hypothetical protein